MSKIREFFTDSTTKDGIDWNTKLENQHCKYLGKKCIKSRKSEPEIAIGGHAGQIDHPRPVQSDHLCRSN